MREPWIDERFSTSPGNEHINGCEKAHHRSFQLFSQYTQCSAPPSLFGAPTFQFVKSEGLPSVQTKFPCHKFTKMHSIEEETTWSRSENLHLVKFFAVSSYCISTKLASSPCSNNSRSTGCAKILLLLLHLLLTAFLLSALLAPLTVIFAATKLYPL